MNVASIFQSFTARYARPAKRIDPRIAIKAALETAEKRRDTREIHACQEALRQATTELFRNAFKGN